MPTVVPVAVRKAAVPALWVALAMPKSVIFTLPSLVTMMFSGFRSRWTIPYDSAWARPARIPSMAPANCASASRPTYGRSDPRSTYSIAMYGVPPSSKYSNTVTMLGWFREPARRDSRKKRSANSGALAWKVLNSFSATLRSSWVWRAR